MFLRRPHYPVSATAIGQVELVSLDAVDFHAMLTGSVETCLLLLGDMSRRLRGLIGEIDDLSLHSANLPRRRLPGPPRPAGGPVLRPGGSPSRS